jgi:hypothetical protein
MSFKALHKNLIQTGLAALTVATMGTPTMSKARADEATPAGHTLITKSAPTTNGFNPSDPRAAIVKDLMDGANMRDAGNRAEAKAKTTKQKAAAQGRLYAADVKIAAARKNLERFETLRRNETAQGHWYDLSKFNPFGMASNSAYAQPAGPVPFAGEPDTSGATTPTAQSPKLLVKGPVANEPSRDEYEAPPEKKAPTIAAKQKQKLVKAEDTIKREVATSPDTANQPAEIVIPSVNPSTMDAKDSFFGLHMIMPFSALPNAPTYRAEYPTAFDQTFKQNYAKLASEVASLTEANASLGNQNINLTKESEDQSQKMFGLWVAVAALGTALAFCALRKFRPQPADLARRAEDTSKPKTDKPNGEALNPTVGYTIAPTSPTAAPVNNIALAPNPTPPNASPVAPPAPPIAAPINPLKPFPTRASDQWINHVGYNAAKSANAAPQSNATAATPIAIAAAAPEVPVAAPAVVAIAPEASTAPAVSVPAPQAAKSDEQWSKHPIQNSRGNTTGWTLQLAGNEPFLVSTSDRTIIFRGTGIVKAKNKPLNMRKMPRVSVIEMKDPNTGVLSGYKIDLGDGMRHVLDKSGLETDSPHPHPGMKGGASTKRYKHVLLAANSPEPGNAADFAGLVNPEPIAPAKVAISRIGDQVEHLSSKDAEFIQSFARENGYIEVRNHKGAYDLLADQRTIAMTVGPDETTVNSDQHFAEAAAVAIKLYGNNLQIGNDGTTPLAELELKFAKAITSNLDKLIDANASPMEAIKINGRTLMDILAPERPAAVSIQASAPAMKHG